MDAFLELVIVLVIAVSMGSLMQALRQPLIIGHIATGILVAALGIVRADDAIGVFAHFGIVLLLFLVGLNLSPRTIKETGKAAVITGLGQVVFTSVVGYGIARLLGFDVVPALYLALGLTFSSTIIISKLLSDRGDLQTLYGRVAIGFLIVQDIVAITVLMFLTGFGSESLVRNLVLAIIAGAFLFVVLKRITTYMARSQELLLLFSVALCVAAAAAFHVIGLSYEAGALIAGIALSASRYRHEIAARLKPLRDFFILMFFIVLGAQMDFTSLGSLVVPAVVFSVFILVGNPLIVIALMYWLGYPRKAGFQAGLTVAQISEFSLILVALGVSLGHVSQELLSLATIVGVVTIAASTYLIMYADGVYGVVRRFLPERKHVKVDGGENKHEILLFGCNRLGFGILRTFNRMKQRFLVIDYDPVVVKKLEQQGVDCRFGDAEDLELLEDLAHENVKMVISTVDRLETNLLLLNTIHEANSHAIFAVVAQTTDDALALYEAGASYVVLPHHIGGDHMGTLIERHGLNPEKYLEEKIRHVEHLRGQK